MRKEKGAHPARRGGGRLTRSRRLLAGEPVGRKQVEVEAAVEERQAHPILDAFFDAEENWDRGHIIVGGPWTVDLLRLKSSADLHKLWFPCSPLWPLHTSIGSTHNQVRPTQGAEHAAHDGARDGPQWPHLPQPRAQV